MERQTCTLVYSKTGNADVHPACPTCTFIANIAGNMD
jgi:hypothetical protein